MKRIVCEHGINDMYDGWCSENEYNKKIYNKWYHMLRRVYVSKYHETHPSYVNSTIKLEWHWLSKFVDDFKKIDGYDEEKLLKGELELDKDIKSNGKNKEYSLENCMLVSKSENSKQSHKTRKYYKSPMYGKHHSKESKNKIANNKERNKKIGDALRGKKRSDDIKQKLSDTRKGKNNPRAIKVGQYDLDDNLIKIWDCIKEATEKLNISKNYISDCCRGKRKTAGGFIWKYYKEEDEKYWEENEKKMIL